MNDHWLIFFLEKSSGHHQVRVKCSFNQFWERWQVDRNCHDSDGSLRTLIRFGGQPFDLSATNKTGFVDFICTATLQKKKNSKFTEKSANPKSIRILKNVACLIRSSPHRGNLGWQGYVVEGLDAGPAPGRQKSGRCSSPWVRCAIYKDQNGFGSNPGIAL